VRRPSAYDGGYACASQFSREYARLFGQPPRRDPDACVTPRLVELRSVELLKSIRWSRCAANSHHFDTSADEHPGW
jgi:hypothetical protein